MNKTIKTTLIFVGILTTLILAYFPTIANSYLYHDDVKFFLKTPLRSLIPDFYNNVFFGRPLGALRLTTYNIFINQVLDLTIFRFLNIIILALCALILVQPKNHYSKLSTQNLLVTLIIFTLPPFQILVAFVGTCATPLALLLVILSARYINKSFISLILFETSLLFYPPITMFFWVMVAVEIFSFQWDDPRQSWIKLTRFLLTGFVAIGLYGLYLLCTKKLFSNLTVSGYDPYHIDLSIASKLYWFIQEPLFNALNLWNIFPSQRFAYTVILFIAGAVTLHFVKMLKITTRQELYSRIVLTILFVLLFPLTFLPNLATLRSFAFYRCLLPLSGSTVLTLTWAAHVWLNLFFPKIAKPLLTAVLFAVLGLGILWSNKNLDLFRVKPSAIEFNYIKGAFKNSNINQLKSIHFVRPNIYKLKYRYDEFGGPTSFYGHNIIPLMTCILRELNVEKLSIYDIKFDFEHNLFTYIFLDHKNIQHIHIIKITSSAQNDSIPFYKNFADIVIDTSNLYKKGNQLDYLAK